MTPFKQTVNHNEIGPLYPLAGRANPRNEREQKICLFHQDFDFRRLSQLEK